MADAPKRPNPRAARPRINLALQGGGAHGAFTWGVIDRLLEGGEVEIAGISGTSAGALNGAALKAGLATGSAQTARETLDVIWRRVGRLDSLRAPAWVQSLWPDASEISRGLETSLPWIWSEFLLQNTSPYSYGPFYQNPLQPILDDLPFDRIGGPEGPDFFVGATNVRSGKIRIFSGEEITPEAIMASACLPTLFQAVEIPDASGEMQAYWDGGYSGNPPLFPLFAQDLPQDIVIVSLNPLYREDLPFQSQEILNRINEISFNASLLSELRSIRFVQRLLDDGIIAEGTMKRVHVHMISNDALMSSLSVATKSVPSAIVIEELKAAGRVAAKRFLDDCLESLGARSSVDLGRALG